MTNLILLVSFLLSGDKAKKIVEELQEHYNDAKSIHIYFQESVRDDFDFSSEIDGEFVLKKPNYYLYKTEERLLISNMKTTWDYRSGINQVRISTYKPNGGEVSFVSFLLRYQKNYNLIYLKKEKELDIIRLFEKKSISESSNFKLKEESITIWVDADKKELKKIVQQKKNGNIVTYVIKKTIFDESFDQKFFQYKNTTKAEEVDLRF